MQACKFVPLKLKSTSIIQRGSKELSHMIMIRKHWHCFPLCHCNWQSELTIYEEGSWCKLVTLSLERVHPPQIQNHLKLFSILFLSSSLLPRNQINFFYFCKYGQVDWREPCYASCSQASGEPAFGEHQHSYSQNYPFYAIVKNYVFLLQNFANTRSLKKLSAVPCHPGHSDCTPNEI